MKTINFKKLKLFYVVLGGIWTLLVIGSAIVNSGSNNVQDFRISLITHLVVWISAIIGIAYTYNQMFRALTNREELALNLENVVRNTDSLIEAVPFGIVIIGKDRIIRMANLEACRILGRRAGEIVGRVCHHTICPAMEEKCPIFDLDQVVDNSEKDVLGFDGEEIPVYKSVIPFNWQGEDVLLEAFVDVSKQKKHEVEMELNLADLQKFNRLAIGRESRMIELKAEINELLKMQGQPDRYHAVKVDNFQEPVIQGESN